jgi:hypothetical protein
VPQRSGFSGKKQAKPRKPVLGYTWKSGELNAVQMLVSSAMMQVMVESLLLFLSLWGFCYGEFCSREEDTGRYGRVSASRLRANGALLSPLMASSHLFCALGTTSVHLKVRESRSLVPKRHQIKHLDLDFHLVREQGAGGSSPLSPITLLAYSKRFKQLSSNRRLSCFLGTVGTTEGSS